MGGRWAKIKGLETRLKLLWTIATQILERNSIFNEYAKTQSVRLMSALAQEPIMWR